MKNRDLILMLVDKSTNAFGPLIGLAEDAKLKVALTIIQDTISTVFGIDSVLLTSTALDEILEKDQLEIDQVCLLTDLLWIQADILLELKQPFASLKNYENALQLLQWQTGLSIEIIHSEKQNKITGLIAAIARFTPESKMKNKTFTIFL